MTWRPTVEAKLADLANLPHDWNSYGAEPISPAVIARTLALLDAVMLPETPAPSLVPMSTDGVQIVWHMRGLDVEVSVHRPGDRTEVWSEDSQGSWQRDFLMGLDDEPRLLRSIVAELTRRP